MLAWHRPTNPKIPNSTGHLWPLVSILSDPERSAGVTPKHLQSITLEPQGERRSAANGALLQTKCHFK